VSAFWDFQPSAPYTLGVELEIQLLDQRSLNLAPAAQDILADLPADLKERIKPEFIRSMVELATGVCGDLRAVELDLRQSYEILEKRAGRSGCLLFAASLHPFARHCRQVLSPGRRYAELLEELQLVGRRLISQGLHVHVGLPDAATTIRVFNEIRRYLPLCLALTTSSPFYEGEDTGFHSYRSKLMDALARAGMPRPFKDWQELGQVFALLCRAGAIRDIREIWWDVRPHPDFGTLEVRICDLPGRFDEILAMTALIQALVKTLAEQNRPAADHPQEIIISNKWEAARHGLAGLFIEPTGQGSPGTISAACRKLLEMTGPAARQLGTREHYVVLERILETGTSGDRLRSLHRQGLAFPEIIQLLRRDFLA
jgi:carboxylate-amine ligase